MISLCHKFNVSTLRSAVLMLLAFVMCATSGSTVYAIDTSFYSGNDIIFYDPDDTECTASDTSSSSAATADASGSQKSFIDSYYSIAQQYNIDYGIPWEAVMAQGILESGSGSSEYARERNNFFGIGAYTSDPDHAFKYATAAEGWKGYYDNIASTSTYREHGAFNYPSDPYGYIKAIKAAGYATDPSYVSKVSSIIDMVVSYSKEKNYKSSSEIVSENPDTNTNAAKYAAGSTAPASNADDSSDSCASTSKGSNGDAKTMADAFVNETHGNVKMPSGYVYSAFSNGCTSVAAWYISQHTDLAYGHGNGKDVVANLAAANGGAVTTEPSGMAIFSVAAGVAQWGASGDGYGHTGLVVSIDSGKKTATVIETGASYANSHRDYPVMTATYPYPTGGVTFYNLTGHTK